MATFTTYVPLNMFTLTPWIGSVTEATSTKLVISISGARTVYTGDFTYHFDGSVTGNVDVMRNYVNGTLIDKTTEFNKDIGDLFAASLISGEATLTLAMSGDDTLNGSSGDDVLLALGGRDAMYGKGGDDVLFGGDGGDWLFGGSGDDTLFGEGGKDALLGGNGKDVLNGGGGNDQLQGGAGRDKLYGKAGNDVLFGEDGNDRLNGGAGKDTINGGAGNDVMTGGADIDTFEFYGADGNDVIKDFTDGVDVLWLGLHGFASAADVIALAAFDGTDTTFDFGGGNTLTLQNFDSANLDATDFVLS